MPLAGDRRNNKMKRMNGEVRDREKVMRGLKKMDTTILPGYRLYHNYFGEHEGWTARHQLSLRILRLKVKTNG